MSFTNYGIYLIPPPPLLAQFAQIHHIMSSEFKAHTGGRFMAHCTVKGFFKLREGAVIKDFMPALDELMRNTPAFYTRLVDMWVVPGMNVGHSPSLLMGMELTPEFHRFHNNIMDIVRPSIAPDCTFTNREWTGQKFTPHITLAMSDLPLEPGLQEQATELAKYLAEKLSREKFLARDMQIIEFTSHNWLGKWWETLDYKQIKGWRLPGA